MKIIVNKIKEKVNPQNKELDLKKLIKKCFALMIDSTDFSKLQIIFRKFIYVFLSPNLTEKVRNELVLISNQKFENNEVSRVFEEEEKDETASNEDEIRFDCFFELITSKSNRKPMYEQSPFYTVFNEILVDVQLHIEQEITGHGNKNPYHAPDFASFITKQYMAYVVLWTAIIIGKRFSNALGENFFRMVKHNWITE
ncbi:MAG TPA: hypothetical protein DD806_02530, partial [Flavobacterium sp.]|nr:hypothetical protein [Flavobacterium sp.]